MFQRIFYRQVKQLNDSFWSGGHEAFLKELAKRYQPQLAELRKRRQESDEADRSMIDAEIERIEALYEEKRDEADQSLF